MDILKMVIRLLKKVTLWIVAIMFVLVATIYAINSRDETLSPTAVSLLKARPDPYRPSSNLYLRLRGLDAPAGISVIAAGEAKVRAYEARLGKTPMAFRQSMGKPTAGSLVFKGKLPDRWFVMGALWREATDHKRQIQRSLTANRVLYRRYRALSLAGGYYDMATANGLGLTPHLPERLRLLFLANFALRIQTGDAAQQLAALTDMEDDLKVWREVLTGYGSLPSKMLAVASLRQDFLLIGSMIADPTVDVSAHRAAMNRLVAPFPISDWKLGSGYLYDYRSTFHDKVMTNRLASEMQAKRTIWQKVENKILEPFYKANATENRWVRIVLRFRAILDGPPRALEQSWVSFRNNADRLDTPGISWLYNPRGKRLLVSTIPWAFREDLQSALLAYDAAALQRMVKLAYEIRVRPVAAANIARFMQANPQWSTHPVDGREFIFNIGKRQLSVEGVGNVSKVLKSFSIPVLTVSYHEPPRTVTTIVSPNRIRMAAPLRRG